MIKMVLWIVVAFLVGSAVMFCIGCCVVASRADELMEQIDYGCMEDWGEDNAIDNK